MKKGVKAMKRYIFLTVCVLALSIPLKGFSQELVLDMPSLALSPDDLLQLAPLGQLETNETTAQCQGLLGLIRKSMPEGIGNEGYLYRLLEVKGESWLAGFRGGELLDLLGEKGKLDGQIFDNKVGVFESESSIFKINLSKGELRYINSSRRFNFENRESRALGREGLPIVESLIRYLGIPESELGDIITKVLKGMAAPIDQKLTTTAPTQAQAVDMELETTFFINRMYNDVPVFNSFLIVGLSNKGEISRFRLKWPQLTLNPELEKATPISEEDLISAVYETVLNHIGCQDPETFKMKIAYVPSRYDTQDEDSSKEEVHPTVFSPKLLVFVRPEDTSQAGEVLEFDLFKTSQ